MRLISAVQQSFSRRTGYEIRRSSHMPKRPIDFIMSRNVDLVVDVGANIGQYGNDLRNRGYQGWIVSFEPVLSTYKSLAAKCKKDDRWESSNLALGETAGKSSINVSDDTVFSSLVPQSEAAIEFDPRARVVRKEEIQIAALDDIFHELPKHSRPFLKIDAQGYEQQVLSGSSACLSQFVGVQLELPIMHLYEGTWRFNEAVSYMLAKGFDISNINPVNYDHTDTASLSEVDCIFRNIRRSPEPSVQT